MSSPFAVTVALCQCAKRPVRGAGGNATPNVNSIESRASAGAFCGEKSALRSPEPSVLTLGMLLTTVDPRFRLAPTAKLGGKCAQVTWGEYWVRAIVGGAVPGVTGS